MISIDYINDNIDVETSLLSKDYNTFMESCEKETNVMFAEFTMIQDKVELESSILGSVSDDLSVLYESEQKNIFAKIGDMIIKIYKKLKEFIQNAIDSVKNLTFKSKSDIQKLDTLIKKYPDLKDEAIAAFNKGALELDDVRSLKELENTFNEIMRLSRKKDMDPKSLKAKWEKAKEKFDKDQREWGIVKVAGTVTVVVGAGVAVATLAPKLVEAYNNMRKQLQESKEAEAEALEELKKVKDADGNNVLRPDIGGLELRVLLHREMAGKRHAVVGNRLSIVHRLVNGVARAVSKFDKIDAERRMENLSATSSKKAERDARELEKSANKAARDARARKEAEYAFDKDHEDETLMTRRIQAAGEARARKEAELGFERDHSKELKDKTYSDSLVRSKGSEAGKDAYHREHPKKP